MTAIDDMVLTGRVKAALAEAKGVSALDVNVDVKNGVVSLKGNVSRQAHDRAIEIARHIEGVRGVEDDLTITSRA